MRFLRSSQRHNFYPRPPRGGRRPASSSLLFRILFLSTPSARRATTTILTALRHLEKFLSTPSARRATLSKGLYDVASDISIHALREEGDALQPSLAGASFYFYPRPPRGGRRSFSRRTLGFFRISIHALREEGDVAADAELYVAEKFLSTPSARRATRRSEQSRHVSAYFYPRPPRGGRRLVLLISAGRIYFYPRPPRGGRPRLRVLDPFVLEISIHALREEGDDDPADDRIPIVVISIHALREEGDLMMLCSSVSAILFLSTPSARRATRAEKAAEAAREISIHALREEGDRRASAWPRS